MYTVYIDSLFVLNLIINYLLLLTSAKIAGREIKKLRLLLGALCGAVYSVLVWLPGFEAIGGIAGKLISLLIIIAAAFAGRTNKHLLRTGIVFCAISFALAGAILAVVMLTGGEPPPGGIPNVPVDIKTLLLATGVSYGLLSLVFRRAARHGPREMQSVTIKHEGRQIHITALIDSGHTLTDPISGAPVIIVDSDAAAALLGFSLDRLQTLSPATAILELHKKTGTRFRLLPYRAVGISSGFLLAFKPDSILLGNEKHRQMLVALSPTPVSDGAAYSALVGSR